jgi:hypothetical protein
MSEAKEAAAPEKIKQNFPTPCYAFTTFANAQISLPSLAKSNWAV